MTNAFLYQFAAITASKMCTLKADMIGDCLEFGEAALQLRKDEDISGRPDSWSKASCKMTKDSQDAKPLGSLVHIDIDNLAFTISRPTPTRHCLTSRVSLPGNPSCRDQGSPSWRLTCCDLLGLCWHFPRCAYSTSLHVQRGVYMPLNSASATKGRNTCCFSHDHASSVSVSQSASAKAISSVQCEATFKMSWLCCSSPLVKGLLTSGLDFDPDTPSFVEALRLACIPPACVVSDEQFFGKLTSAFAPRYLIAARSKACNQSSLAQWSEASR